MKKKMISCILVLAVLLGNLSLMGVAVHGLENSLLLKTNADTDANLTVYAGESGSTVSLSHVDGNYPAGMALNTEGNTVRLAGRAAEANTYTFTAYITETNEAFITEENPDGIQEITVHVQVEVYAKTITAAVFEKALTVNTACDFSVSMGSENISKVEVASGSIPAGLTMTSDAKALYFKGTPTKLGTFEFTVTGFDSGENAWRSQPVKLKVEEAAPPKVTKDPTSETLAAGGSAIFIAKADNAKVITWYLESPDSKKEIRCVDAPHSYVGLKVKGHDSERLTLDNIPIELDQWKVKAKFEGDGGETWSKTATLFVNKPELKEPVITTQPRGSELEYGTSTVLKVTAVSPDGNKLIYQWYMNDSNSVVGGRTIPGATEATYIPEYLEGTVYYYCAVRNTDGNDISNATKSDVIAVVYAPKATEPTQPETTEPADTQPEETQPEETILMTEPAAQPQSKSNTPVIVLGIVACVAVIGVCATVLILRFFPRDEDDD